LFLLRYQKDGRSGWPVRWATAPPFILHGGPIMSQCTACQAFQKEKAKKSKKKIKRQEKDHTRIERTKLVD
jgi:hypothetical protein